MNPSEVWFHPYILQEQYDTTQPLFYPSHGQIDQLHSHYDPQGYSLQGVDASYNSSSSSSLSSLSSLSSTKIATSIGPSEISPSLETQASQALATNQQSKEDKQSDCPPLIRPTPIVASEGLYRKEFEAEQPSTRKRSITQRDSSEASESRRMSNDSDFSLSSQVLPSVYRQELCYMPYSANVSSTAIEEEYIRLLTAADSRQICYSFRHRSVEKKHFEKELLMTAEQYARSHQLSLASYQDVGVDSINADNSVASDKGADKSHQDAISRAAASQPLQASEGSRPRKVSKVAKPTITQIVKIAPKQEAIPSPKLILSERAYTQKEVILRHIASFLDEQDALMFAMSDRIVFAALDFSWWESHFLLKSENIRCDHAGIPLWPSLQGWCDACEIKASKIMLQDLSKARLCHLCFARPELQTIRFAEGKKLFDLKTKAATNLLNLMPFKKERVGKSFWLPHLQWIHNQVGRIKKA